MLTAPLLITVKKGETIQMSFNRQVSGYIVVYHGIQLGNNNKKQTKNY